MSVDEIRGELEDLSDILASFDGEPEPLSPEWMNRQSLLTRQNELHQELELATGEYEFEVQLAGGAVAGSSVRTSFLGAFLDELQAILKAVAQSLMHGTLPTRGRVAADVVAASDLRIVATQPGSFVIGFSGPVRGTQPVIDGLDEGEDELPPLDEAIERLLDVVGAAETDITGERLSDAVGGLGGQRAVRHLEELLKAMASTGTNAMLVHRHGGAAEARQQRLTSGGAARLGQVLSRTEQDIEYQVVEGLLSGVRWKTGIFDLEVEDQESGQATVYSGHVVRDLRPLIRDSFDQPVEATLEVTITRIPAQEHESVKYRLIAVTPREEQS